MIVRGGARHKNNISERETRTVTSTPTKWSQDYLAAFNSHDTEKFLSFYTEDCTWQDTGLGQAYHRTQEIRNSVTNLSKAAPDVKLKIDPTDVHDRPAWKGESSFRRSAVCSIRWISRRRSPSPTFALGKISSCKTTLQQSDDLELRLTFPVGQ